MLKRISKTIGYEDPTIWYKYGRLALATKSVNMGQGFPDWQPPEFFIESLVKNITSPNANHQYTRSFGNIKLCENLANHYKASFGRTIDPMSEVLVACGGVSVLYNTITALVENGDEVIFFEPFYESYFPEIKFTGGTPVGIPMIPPKLRKKSEFKFSGGDEQEMEKFYSQFRDTWTIDFDKFEAALSDKTRLLLLNTPNNPTGKILTNEELLHIAKILEKYPNVVILMDEVYEYMIFDDFKTLPRMANLPGMWDKTITMMSAGKTFSSTGNRVAWAIGPKDLIKKVNAVYQYNTFCMYDPTMLAIADCLEIATKAYKGYDSYYEWLRAHYLKQRNYIVNKLANCDEFDLDFFIPEGGYFIVASLDGKDVKPTKHRLEGDEHIKEGSYLKDYNYLIDLAYDKNIVGIPCSAFYTEPYKNIGENYIRLAFCKQTGTIDKMIEKLKINN
jgi:kynurenine--oxoglutarate transaminase/cysteine-S-conjugate beta-lyase/glutamine--phenylpyruvate transaminase